MRRLALASLVLALSTLGTVPARAEPRSPWAESRDEDLVIRLATFGPGEEIHQYFGHNALEVRDEARGISILYNFGMFSFGPDMLPKYLQGRLEFWAAPTPTRATIQGYIASGRSVGLRELDLPAASRRVLAERLSFFVRPENRSYRYHHYDNNCSTRLRDLLDDAIGGQLRLAHTVPARMTYREHTLRYTEHDSIVAMLLVLWMNDSMERPIQRYQETYLPDELERIVDLTRYRDESGREIALVGKAFDLAESRLHVVPARPSVLWPRMLAFGIFLGTLAFAFGRWEGRTKSRVARMLLGVWHAAVGLLYGVPGLVLFLFLFTEWEVTHYDENLFLVNPFTFAALPLGIAIALGSERALAWMRSAWFLLTASSIALVVLKLLPAFDQDTTLPFALALPVNFGFALGLLGAPGGRRVAGASSPRSEPRGAH